MCLHIWHHQLSSHSTLTGAVPPQAKNKKQNLVSMYMAFLWLRPTFYNPIDCGLTGLSVREVLQAIILKHIGQYWLPYPSRALYFLLPYPPTPLNTWCALWPKQLHHLHTSPSQEQNQVLQGSLRSKPQWTTHVQKWK